MLPRALSILLLLGMLSAGLPAICGAEPFPPVKTRQALEGGGQPVKIVCLGDSITGVYYHTGGRRAYPEMLGIALKQACPRAQVTVRNAGVSGNTTRDALARLDRDVLAHHPQLVTVMFGMNDVVRVPLPEFEDNLRRISRACRTAGAEVLLCTQNSVMVNDARPAEKLAAYTQVILKVGREESLPVADCHEVYESTRARDPMAWRFLLSETIHPNMEGHRVFATTIAKTILGRETTFKETSPLSPALPRTQKLLTEHKVIRVLAMPPYDQWITPALRQILPDAEVIVTPWPTKGEPLTGLEQSAKQIRVKGGVDLVVIAVPTTAGAETPEAFHEHYSWILNGALSFGRQEWDVLALPPSFTTPTLSPAEQHHDKLARQLIAGKDLNVIVRAPNDTRPATVLLNEWLALHLTSLAH